MRKTKSLYSYCLVIFIVFFYIVALNSSIAQEKQNNPIKTEITIPICLHITGEDAQPIKEYYDKAIVKAQTFFITTTAVFSLRYIHYNEPSVQFVQSADERDALAKYVNEDDCVHVFLVPRLFDLDHKDTDIAGRHWQYLGREKKYQKRRYIIVAPQSFTVDVLAHELGHFFGLKGHHKSPKNLMYAAPDDPNPVLTSVQLRILRKGVVLFNNSKN
ncbi:MAG: hypothetical protein JW841_02570 [Deltaproteobacteria bacterium]|nr:hypothetical protein [Deltaproteobacteria bacterium]